MMDAHYWWKMSGFIQDNGEDVHEDRQLGRFRRRVGHFPHLNPRSQSG
jgi:hypothetical protein